MIWPLPAVLSWLLAWAVFKGLSWAGAAPVLALSAAVLTGTLAAFFGQTRWRRAWMAAGFPLSALAADLGAGVPAWLWLGPLALLLLLYPLRSWRDAPLFPTPSRALEGLADCLDLPADASIVDAGCGLGDGLIALHREWPNARLTGWEWSWPLMLACRLRCRFARVRRADIWSADWSGHQAVYLFQRPESLPRAVAKAAAELAPGAWLLSLEFEATTLRPQVRLESVAGKPVWGYRAPFVVR